MAGQEFLWIDWVRKQVKDSPRLIRGIGDDTAVYRFPQAGDCLITTDLLMEGTHFRFPDATPREAGHKVLGASVSDIAAMAGLPLGAVISVVFSRKGSERFAEEFYAGVMELAREFQIDLAGGDTNSWDGPFVANVTLWGEPTGSGPVLRSGAKAGDRIFVTGELGGSLEGHHLRFTPRVREAIKLHETVGLHAMLDLSDGLVSDLNHILEESRVGAILEETAIPISAAARQMRDGRSPLEHALHDGEDFELLLTVSEEHAEKLRNSNPLKIPLTEIGVITSDPGCRLRTEKQEILELPPQGWQHLW